MKILILCNRIPYPPHDGGAVAMYNMIKGLRDMGCHVHLFALNTPKHYFNPWQVPESLIPQNCLTTVYTDTRVKSLPAFFNLFTNQSYNIVRFYNPGAENAIVQLLQSGEFDAVQMEGLFMAPYLEAIRNCTDVPVLLRSHNVEHVIWERMAAGEKHPLKKWYLNLLARRLKTYETEKLPAFDAIAAITPDDKKLTEQWCPGTQVFTLPAGIDMKKFTPDTTSATPDDASRSSGQPQPSSTPQSVFHLGALDWMPNQEGVRWFIKEVWPLIVKAVPETCFYIAGRHIPDTFYKYESDNIRVLGEVPDAGNFMAEKGIMVVPLQSGSGMRIKIIEGMAIRKAIVSTTIGAEGIKCRDGHDIMIADQPADFAVKVISLLKDQALTSKIGSNARQTIEENYTSEAVAHRLISYYKEHLLTCSGK